MNEHERSIHVNNNSQIQVVKPEFTTWKYKVKLSAEAVMRICSVKRLFVKMLQYSQKNCIGVSF